MEISRSGPIYRAVGVVSLGRRAVSVRIRISSVFRIFIVFG